jgi:hypothetical protein
VIGTPGLGRKGSKENTSNKQGGLIFANFQYP